MFIYLDCGGSSLLCTAFAEHSWGQWGPLFIVVRGLLAVVSSLMGYRLSSCGTRAQLLQCLWNLPGPGIEPVSPALGGRVLTAGPPGKHHKFFNSVFFELLVFLEVTLWIIICFFICHRLCVIVYFRSLLIYFWCSIQKQFCFNLAPFLPSSLVLLLLFMFHLYIL